SSLRSRSGSPSDSPSRITMSRPGTDRPLSMKLRWRWVVPARSDSSSWLSRSLVRRSRSIWANSTPSSCSAAGRVPAIPRGELPVAAAAPTMASMNPETVISAERRHRHRPEDGGKTDLGVLLPVRKAQWGDRDPRELLDFAARAEDLGYSSLWAND